jgi:CDP-diacylglycerol--serine O-phosphatidyltransferase
MQDGSTPSRLLLHSALRLLPNFLTLCAILCGLTSIRLSAEGELGWAAGAIFAAAALDAADGFAARRLSAVTAIGAELDSLADCVNFGAAPAMLLYWHSLHLLGEAGWLIAGLYVLATAMRLARFNVQSKEPGEAPGMNWFYGLPSTGAAAGAVIADLAVNALFEPETASVIVAGSALAASVLMLSALRVPAPFKRGGAGTKGN